MEEKTTDVPFRAKICMGHVNCCQLGLLRAPNAASDLGSCGRFGSCIFHAIESLIFVARFVGTRIHLWLLLTACDESEGMAAGLVQGLS